MYPMTTINYLLLKAKKLKIGIGSDPKKQSPTQIATFCPEMSRL
jgi:hypothetical protein